ncbi:hypothetical protein [Plantactinospora sp. CA-290183]|uniref:hypothetical protein n=1 Tax=Plantactinospora sp. CA-290183 TaxID=3240006 RepID=UPI003D8E17C4
MIDLRPPARRVAQRLAIAALAVLALPATAACTASTSTPSPPSASQQPPPSAPPACPVQPRPVLPQLCALAAAITAVPADSHPGPHIEVDSELWARSTDRLLGSREVWRHTKGRPATLTERRAPGPVGLTRPPNASERARLARAEPVPASGDPQALVPEPILVDPRALAAQLAAHAPPQAHTQTLLSNLSRMAAQQYLNRGQRAAVLIVLATVDGVHYAGPTRDIAGRSGVAVTVTSARSTWQIIVDPTTGELLSYTETITAGYRRGIWAIRLYLSRSRHHTPGPVLAQASGPWAEAR